MPLIPITNQLNPFANDEENMIIRYRSLRASHQHPLPNAKIMMDRVFDIMRCIMDIFRMLQTINITSIWKEECLHFHIHSISYLPTIGKSYDIFVINEIITSLLIYEAINNCFCHIRSSNFDCYCLYYCGNVPVYRICKPKISPIPKNKIKYICSWCLYYI